MSDEQARVFGRERRELGLSVEDYLRFLLAENQPGIESTRGLISILKDHLTAMMEVEADEDVDPNDPYEQPGTCKVNGDLLQAFIVEVEAESADHAVAMVESGEVSVDDWIGVLLVSILLRFC